MTTEQKIEIVKEKAPYLNEDQIKHAIRLDVKNLGSTWTYQPREEYGGPDITPQNVRAFREYWYNDSILSNGAKIDAKEMSPFEAVQIANMHSDNMLKYYRTMKKAYDKGQQYFKWKLSPIGREPVLTKERFSRFKEVLEKYAIEQTDKLNEEIDAENAVNNEIIAAEMQGITETAEIQTTDEQTKD